MLQVWSKPAALKRSVSRQVFFNDVDERAFSSFSYLVPTNYQIRMQADFMKMPFPENSFDAVYAIEATCHAPDAVFI